MFRVHVRSLDGTSRKGRFEDSYTVEQKYDEATQTMVDNILSAGGYGQLKVAHRADGARVAVKQVSVKKSEDWPLRVTSHKALMREIKFLNVLFHENIVTLYDFFERPSGICYIVTEFCSGGELFDFLLSDSYQKDPKRFDYAASIIREMLEAVRYCHEQGIVHRDIKPENVVLSHPFVEGMPMPSVKLIDFGLSATFEQLRLQETVGTPGYGAPEIIRPTTYNQLCDEWSVGVVMFLLIYLYPPYNYGKDNKVLMMTEPLPPPHGFDQIPESPAKNLIGRFLCLQEHRISAKDALNHPWFSLHEVVPLPVPDNVLVDRFKQHACQKKLVRMIRYHIVSAMRHGHAPNTEITRLKDMYKLHFTGPMTIDDARKKLKSIVHTQNDIDALDLNRDGVLDWNELLCNALPPRLYDTYMRIGRVFDAFDRNKDGRLSFSELYEMLLGSVDDAKTVYMDMRRVKTAVAACALFKHIYGAIDVWSRPDMLKQVLAIVDQFDAMERTLETDSDFMRVEVTFSRDDFKQYLEDKLLVV